MGTFLMGHSPDRTACELFDHYFRRSGHRKETYNYFAFRFGQPRHLVGLSLLQLVQDPRKPVLDLACGFGQLTRSLGFRAAGQRTFAVDKNFFCLYVARHWIAPDADYICCDVDNSLPFPGDSLSAVFCSDAVQYLVQKAVAFREMRRVIDADGIILLASMRNALVEQLHASYHLAPEGYQALMADIPHRMVSDDSILRTYRRGRGPALAKPDDSDRLRTAPLLSVVASQRAEVLTDHGEFAAWPHAEGPLGLNPLYERLATDGHGTSRLRRVFPSPYYEAENSECKEYLPETLEVDDNVLHDARIGKRTPAIDQLIERFVLLGLPERFRSAS
jgi:SAM-dependent methyltransferase